MLKEPSMFFEFDAEVLSIFVFNKQSVEKQIAPVWIAFFAHRVNDLIGRKCKSVDRDWIAVMKPKRNSRAKLTLRGIQFLELENCHG